jgi:hypothetical protein
VRLPFGPLACPGCRTLLNYEDTISSHHRKAHPDARSRWVCFGCDTPFVTYRAVKCHLPKCTARKVVTGDYFCNSCNRRFESQRGLSLHKRRAHPDLRNEELLEPPLRAEQRPTALRPPIWSNEEINILERYERLYAGDLHINMKIATNLPFKTNKQVRSYRMERRKKSRTAADVGQQGGDPNDGRNEILASQPMGGLEPAEKVLSLSEGERSPLVDEREPCFSSDAPHPGGA